MTPYSSGDGLASGWVSRELPDVPALMAESAAFARSIAANPRGPVAAVKRILRRGSSDELTPPSEYVWNEE